MKQSMKMLMLGVILSLGISPPVSADTNQSQMDNYAKKLPQYFIENRVQGENQIKFYSPGGQFYFTPEGIFTHLIQRDSTFQTLLKDRNHQDLASTPVHEKHVILKKRFLNTNPHCEIVGENELPGKVNYFIGSDSTKWTTNLRTYKQIRYKNIYPGIDLIYHGKNGPTEYDLVINPESHTAKGSSIPQIQFNIEGADKLELSTEGDLLVHTPLGILKEKAPVSWQEKNGTHPSIASKFTISPGNTVSFDVPQYDKSYPLVIDPLIFSTYLGGSGSEYLRSICLDTGRNIILTGYTNSTDFHITPGSFDTTFSGGSYDVFVTKLNAAGTALIYSTYLGGSAEDRAESIAIDSAGNVYIGGYTSSTTTFPVTAGAYDTSYNGGNYDAYVVKINSSGSSLIYSTFLGGDNYEKGNCLDIDDTGSVYIAGYTRSASSFPVTAGAYDTSYNEAGTNGDVFVTRLNSAGSSLMFSTFIGGTQTDEAFKIKVGPSGETYIAGNTESPSFPVTATAYDTSYNELGDIFVCKLNAPGSTLMYSTFLGGEKGEFLRGLDIDSVNNVYVSGYTYSTTGNTFPTTSNAYDTTFGGSDDAFLSKLNSTGSGLLYSTLLGGSTTDRIEGLVVDTNGKIILTGTTASDDFPTTSDAYDKTSNGERDIFLAIMDINTTPQLVYSSYIGGSYSEYGQCLAVDTNHDYYIAGVTDSHDFPTTPGSFIDEATGGYYGYLLKLGVVDQALLPRIPQLPGVKLFKNESAFRAFCLEDFNVQLPGQSYSITTNFINMATLSGPTVSFSSYASATGGKVHYSITNTNGPGYVSNDVRYSTYKVRKLPFIALRPGKTETIRLTDYCYDISGLATPNSFGDRYAANETSSGINVSWLDSSYLRVTTLSGFTSGSAIVRIVASPSNLTTLQSVIDVTDYSVEPLVVYPDLLSVGTFTSASDLSSQFGVEGLGGFTLPTIGYQPQVIDSSGTKKSGVISFDFTGNTQGVKLTPIIGSMVSCDSEQWYTARIRIYSPNPGNSMEAQLYNFRGIIPTDSTVDLGANILFGVPTTWSWLDIPVYTTATGKGYPQIILKGGKASGTIYLQSVQYIKATPPLMETTRGHHDLHYPYARPTTMSQLTSGWATGELYGPETPSGLSFGFENNTLTLDYTGASSGNNQKGSKVTAKKNHRWNLYRRNSPRLSGRHENEC